MLLIGWKSGARIFSLSQGEAMQYQGFTKVVVDNQVIFHRLKHFGSVI